MKGQTSSGSPVEGLGGGFIKPRSVLAQVAIAGLCCSMISLMERRGSGDVSLNGRSCDIEFVVVFKPNK